MAKSGVHKPEVNEKPGLFVEYLQREKERKMEAEASQRGGGSIRGTRG